MSISDKTRKALEKIGLTSYEIRTYTALLKSGELTASDLSQKSGVPYSKIYEVLGTLEDKGWIGSDESRPTKYFAKSPSTGLETTKQKMDSDFKENNSVIVNELIPLYEKSGTSEKPDIWFLSGTINIAAKILEMVESCRNE
ncbi:transcriptional regulator, partial [Nitrosopumilus sp. b1]|uniref:TrmB family transcriptional regulator n=1 Tax=Nitrosopumilus sp. b1 TaxID=2109907 RepID=UPI0015F4919D